MKTNDKRFKKGRIEVCRKVWFRDNTILPEKVVEYWVRYKNRNGRIGWHTETYKRRGYAMQLGQDWAAVIGCDCTQVTV